MADLKTLLNEKAARLIERSGADLSVSTRVKRWFPDVHADDVTAAVNYLNTKTSVLNDAEASRFYVENPMADGVPLPGIWRLVYAGVDEGRGGVVEVLAKGFVESLVPDGGSAPSVDWSEFVLLKESGYHANHEMPVLRLNSVAPTAAAGMVSYLNQDSFADIVYRDGTLSGAWRRVEVLAEQDQDGSYHIDVLLTDSGNTSLYVRFMAAPTVWKGLYHKWDADEATIAELESTIQFSSTGEIVESGGKTLREAQAGRSVAWAPVRRAGDTRLFELVAEITWTVAKTDESEPSGTYDTLIWVERFINAAALPSAADLAPLYDAPGKGNADHVPGNTEWGTSGVASDPLVYGLWSITRTLTGPNGSGTHQPNEDGTFSYAIVWRKTLVIDSAWHLSVGPISDPQRTMSRVNMSPQQIRRIIGGELEFRKDENGVLIGISWNTAFSADHDGKTDTTAPAAWESLGYRSKYGQWKSDWTKYTYPNRTGSGVFQGSYSTPPTYVDQWGVALIGAVTGAATASITYAAIGNVWYDYTGQNFYMAFKTNTSTSKLLTDTTYFKIVSNSASYSNTTNLTVYNTNAAGDLYCYTPTNRYFISLTGVSGTLTDTSKFFEFSGPEVLKLCPGKIARRGVGTWPFEEPDLYIPVLQPVGRELRWDNDFDIDRNYGDTSAPAAWVSNGYAADYGAWNPTWEKQFIQNIPGSTVGTGSSTSSPAYVGTSGHVFITILSSTSQTVTNYRAKDVWFASGNFYVAPSSGAGPTAISSFTQVTPANARTQIPGLPGYIAIRGSGVYPNEETASIGVITANGSYALSSSARVSFYTNLAENPRWLEVWEGLLQQVESVTLRTYFAFNPHWLDASYRRVPKAGDFSDAEDRKNYAAALTNGYFTIPYDTVDFSNFSMKPNLVPLSDGVWAYDLTIEIRGPLVADSVKLQEKIDSCGPYSRGAVSGCRAHIYTDMTDLISPPWVGTFKEVG